VLFRDDFNGTIDSNWTIQNDDSAYYNTMADHLELRANAGDIWEGQNNHKNLFLIDTPTTGNFDLTIRVIEFSPVHQHAAQIDLIAYDDDDNLVRNIYGYPFGAHYLEFGSEVGGVWSNTANADPEALTPIDFGSAPFYLRLRKIGDTYRQYYSTDGVVFTSTVKTITYGDGTPAKIGFVALADPSESSLAKIDWVEVTRRYFFLTLVENGMGTVDTNPEQPTYDLGETLTLTATADPGWTFAGWSGDLIGTTSPVSVTMNTDKVITATFTQDEYAVTVNVMGSGSVSNTPGNPYTYGQVATLQPVASEGWVFVGWSEDDADELVDNDDGTWGLQMDENKDITATFERRYYIYLPLANSPNTQAASRNYVP
jgi:uncharacterized repeat protein (TIGR02543 family)